MFSGWKQVAYDVKDGIAKQKKLVILYLIWSIICIYWGVWNFSNSYKFYQVDISTADLLILLQYPFNFGIMICPAAMFLMLKCKQNSLNMQFILRYGSRERVLCRQIMESMVYAVVFVIILVGSEFAFSFAKTGQLINWNSAKGLYYVQTGNLITQNFIPVLGAICLMYYIKFMLMLIILDVLLWYPRFIFLLWILVVLPVSIESLGTPVFYLLFAVQYSLWQSPWKEGLLAAIGFLVYILLFLVGRGFVSHKDIFK